jgi:hypothetical protein
MSAPEHGSTICKNCQTAFEGKFCPNCSQKADTHRFSLMHFGHELVHAITHTDKGILYLIKELFIRPGIVAREYMEGKRKKYFNPITFLLIMMALQIYASRKTDIFTAYITANENFVQSITPKNSTQNNESLKGLRDLKEKSPKLLENSKLMTFLFIPVMALASWLFFWKSGFNYAENLILNILIQGQSNLLFLIVGIIPFLLFPSIVGIILAVQQFVVWVYSMIAYMQFYQQRKWVTVLKGSAVMILYYGFSNLISKLVMDYL